MSVDWNAHERLRLLSVGDIMPGLAESIYEVGMRYVLRNPDLPINLIIRSDGGAMFEAISVYNALRDIKSGLHAPLIGSGQGNACSGGSFVLQVCDKRYASPSAFLMVHGTSTGMFRGDETSIVNQAALLKQLRAILTDAYAARSSKPLSYWERVLKSDRAEYYTAVQALEAGLIDAIR